jgi:hypothetical protein
LQPDPERPAEKTGWLSSGCCITTVDEIDVLHTHRTGNCFNINRAGTRVKNKEGKAGLKKPFVNFKFLCYNYTVNK